MENKSHIIGSRRWSEKLLKIVSDWGAPAFAGIAVLGMLSALLAFLLSPAR